jgi:hypothetical protein
LSTLWTSLRLTNTRERLGIALGLLVVLGVLAAAVSSGVHVGAHIWRPGWYCGERQKGGLFCVPDPQR